MNSTALDAGETFLRAEEDRKHCIELNADHWKRRGLLHRAQDSALYLFNEVL